MNSILSFPMYGLRGKMPVEKLSLLIPAPLSMDALSTFIKRILLLAVLLFPVAF